MFFARPLACRRTSMEPWQHAQHRPSSGTDSMPRSTCRRVQGKGCPNPHMRLSTTHPCSSSDCCRKQATGRALVQQMKRCFTAPKLLHYTCCAYCLICACGRHPPASLRQGHSGRGVAVSRGPVTLRSQSRHAQSFCRLLLGSRSFSSGSIQGHGPPGLAAQLRGALFSRCSRDRSFVWGPRSPGAPLGGRATGPGCIRRGRHPAAGPPATLHLHQLLHRAALRRAQEAPAGAALALGRMDMPRLVQERLQHAQRACSQQGQG